ncbi:hypothetical protein ORD22_12320 [Sporosarcina sp. GW1-11]|uniref:hypothetical protein n=1 Tax=Sporosarcina sp. GW1-11 TaxID=2899126 RepID=UPI00294DFCCF|nr:hypothetical protein [Sporosarcina sp. GW1-11]MDV6378999.1 hypothetical protein [Sporosarcina sp. GW1-11]
MIQNESKRKIKKRESITLRGVLNIYGLMAIIGLVLTIYTHRIRGIGLNGFYFDKELMMSREKSQEFLTFLVLKRRDFVYFFFYLLLYGFVVINKCGCYDYSSYSILIQIRKAWGVCRERFLVVLWQ